MTEHPVPDETDEEAADLTAAEAFLDALDKADPATLRVDIRDDLRRVGEANVAIDTARDELAAAVAAARDNGRSWGQIGMVLGVSKQAARERFSLPRQRADEPSTPAETRTQG